MKYLRYYMVALYFVLSLSCNSHAYLLMASKEKKLQISENKGATWEPYNIGVPVDSIDFFDAQYLPINDTIYAVGYDLGEQKFVMFSGKRGVLPFKKEFILTGTPILGSHATIEFMQIKHSTDLLHVFGRVVHNCQESHHAARERDFHVIRTENFHSESSDDYNLPYNPYADVDSSDDDTSTWKRFSDALFKKQLKVKDRKELSGSMVLNIIPTYDEPGNVGYCMHTIAQKSGPVVYYKGRKPVFKEDTVEESFWGFPIDGVTTQHDKVVLSSSSEALPVGHGYFSTLLNHPETGSGFVFGVNPDTNVLFSKKIGGKRAQYLENPLYSELGTAFLPHNASEPQLIFAIKKDGDSDETLDTSNATAVIAYGDNISSLTVAKKLDESLQIKNLTRQGLESLKQRSGFYQFLQDRESHLFVLSIKNSQGAPISLVLESLNGGKTWDLIQSALLPQTVRAVVTIPETS